jgi:proline iminopeptidase
MEYAIRRPDHVSHLVLMGTAPASGRDAELFRRRLRAGRPPGDVERMQAIVGTTRYRDGDLEAEADYYRIHFGACFRRSEQLDALLGRLRAHFCPETVLLARAIEDRLYEQTWSSDGYDLIPKLRPLTVPTLLLHGDRDFVPLVVPAHIAQAVSGSRLIVLPDCGHFAYLEYPREIAHHVTAFVTGA